MATYFDSTDANETALLHAAVRTHTELARVAAEVENEIIDVFTKEGASPLAAPTDSAQGVYQVLENQIYYTTYLWGYRPAVADAAGYNATRTLWTGFCKAMRQTIANVVSHRLRNYDDEQSVVAETHGRESWQYGGDRNVYWPRGWSRLLDKYVPKGYDPRIVWSP